MGLVSSGDEYLRRGDQALDGIPRTCKVVDDILAHDEDYATHLCRPCLDDPGTLRQIRHHPQPGEDGVCGIGGQLLRVHVELLRVHPRRP